MENPNRSNLEPHLDADTLDFLRSRWPQVKGYLEFGCGGSTLDALATGAALVIGIESDKQWVSFLSDEAKCRGQSSRLTLLHADIGATGRWGHPRQRADFKMGMAYTINLLLALESRLTESVELVLVDGRFRIAATLAAVLLLPNTSEILVDDYAKRQHYSPLALVLGDPEPVGSAAIFHRNARWLDRESLVSSLMEHLGSAS